MLWRAYIQCVINIDKYILYHFRSNDYSSEKQCDNSDTELSEDPMLEANQVPLNNPIMKIYYLDLSLYILILHFTMTSPYCKKICHCEKFVIM